MDWLQVLVIVFGNAAWTIPMWLWTRSESRADVRAIDLKIETMRQEANSILKAIQQEIKDFHGRLCAIEERNRGK
jgi:hypothetical protein